jgi:hypothetical protein
MAFVSSSDFYEAVRNLFATTFFDKHISSVRYEEVPYSYPGTIAIERKDWRIVFNHFVPDIDYNTLIVYNNELGQYYDHNQNYIEPLNKTRHKLFYDQHVTINDENGNSLIIKIGRKYKYIYS